MTEKREINLEHPAYPKYATVYSEGAVAKVDK